MDANVQQMLLKKAGALLARRSYSRGELRNKLAKSADKTQVEIALDRLESLHLLNDEEYAYNFALDRIMRQGWGSAKALNALLRRHVVPCAIEAAMARIQKEIGEEYSLDSCIQQYFRKKGRPPDPQGVRKLAAHLRRRGFDEDDIFRALRQALPDAD